MSKHKKYNSGMNIRAKGFYLGGIVKMEMYRGWRGNLIFFIFFLGMNIGSFEYDPAKEEIVN